MTSSKARVLRERLSIDPDVPERAAPPTRGQQPADGRAPSPRPATSSAVEQPREDPAAAPEAPAEVAPASSTSGAGTAVPTEQRSVTPGRGRRRGTQSRGRTSRPDPTWPTAVDDPAITAGSNGYRSFYVSDEVFARFRAAVYWTARRPDASDVPDNMSAGVQAYMESMASELEQRFHDGAVFPPTPDQYRSHRKRATRED